MLRDLPNPLAPRANPATNGPPLRVVDLHLSLLLANPRELLYLLANYVVASLARQLAGETN